MLRSLTLPFLVCAAMLASQPLGAQTFGADPFARESDGKARPLHIEIRSSLDFSRATATGNNGGSIVIDPESSVTGAVSCILYSFGSRVPPPCVQFLMWILRSSPRSR